MDALAKVEAVLPALSKKLSSANENAREELFEYLKMAKVPEVVGEIIRQMEVATYMLSIPVCEYAIHDPAIDDSDIAEVSKAAAEEISKSIAEISRLSVELSKLRDGVQS